jgi:transketolase
LQVEDLKIAAKKIRRDIILSTAEAGSGHYMSSLSTVEILVSIYHRILNHDPKNPEDADRDRFILSKGHAAPALYAILAEIGYFPIDELKSLRKFGSRLQGHPESQLLPGLDSSSGSLGQGLSIAVGIALAGKLDKKNYRVYTLLGDGECQEGQVWEAAMAGAHYNLDNLTAIIDRNGLQSSGKIEEIMSLGELKDKWSSFGWKVFEIDGHDFTSLLSAFNHAKNVKNQPAVILANTVKGYGVPFIEGNLYYHTAPLTEAEVKRALESIG